MVCSFLRFWTNLSEVFECPHNVESSCHSLSYVSSQVTHSEELPELPERLDDGFRAGLRLLHTEELRRACMERGLDFEGKKGDLLNRLLVHFARAPVPTPTQDVGSLLEPQKPNLHAPPTTPKATEATPTPADAKRSTSKPNLPDPRTVAPPAQTGKAPKCTEKAQSSEAKNDAPKASRAVEKPQELQFPDLRPLPPVVKAAQ